MSADVGAAETVMFRDGFLSEGAASNVWVVKDGRVIGVPKDNLVLEGIRYGLLEELCMAGGHPVRAAARDARRSVRGRRDCCCPPPARKCCRCTRLDGRAIGNGKPGPIYEKLYAGYQRAKHH